MTGWRALVCAQLLFLESENPNKEISIYINSPGGVVTSGLAMYDTMQFIRPAVSTAVHRSGGLGGVAAADGRRQGQALQPAECQHHGPPALGRLSGPGDGYRNPRQGNPSGLKRRLNEIYVKHTGQDLRHDRERDGTRPLHDPEEAKDFGLIDQAAIQRTRSIARSAARASTRFAS
jgi:ATP-dependent Clp protease protease subunit